jgi:hypothetical protein
MSTTPIGSSTTSNVNLVAQLVDQIDANHDGQITTNEFGAFLKSLVQQMASTAQATGTSSKSSTAATDTTDTAPDIAPAAWTDNNDPYGVTFAGFSPQEHTNLTLADLGVPGKAEKYAAYNYLLSNKVQPTKNWAPAAADALNQKYNTTVFKAIDGETLGYGDEYIHSAANGYGLLAGQYDTSATGEFFWGTA